MKKLGFVLMLLLFVSGVSAVDVDCSEGRWNSDVCRDHELQDEFDEVVDLIEDNDERDDDQDGKIKKNAKKNNKQQKLINGLEDTIEHNNAAWLAGDGDGIGLVDVREFVYGGFLDFLNGLFVGVDEHESLTDKVYGLEARIYFLEEGLSYDSDDLFFQAVAIKMEDLGKSRVEYQGATCTHKRGVVQCLK